MLRREGIYHSHLIDWRAKRAQGGVAGLVPNTPGPAPKLDAKDREILALNSKLKKLEKELLIVNGLVELQKSTSDVQCDAAGRRAMTALVVGSSLPRSRSCSALGVSRALAYRSVRASGPRHGPRQVSHRRLSEVQRDAILVELHSERFCEQAPAHVYRALLGEGRYLGSIRTSQRILKALGELRERRPVRAAQRHAIPRLAATGPNQVWTWDSRSRSTGSAGRPASPSKSATSAARVNVDSAPGVGTRLRIWLPLLDGAAA